MGKGKKKGNRKFQSLDEFEAEQAQNAPQTQRQEADVQVIPDQRSSTSSLTGESVSQTSSASAKHSKQKGSSKTQKHSSESSDKSDLQLKPDQGSSTSSLTGESVSQTSSASAKHSKQKGSSKTQKHSTESLDKSDLQLKPDQGSSTSSLTGESVSQTSSASAKHSKQKGSSKTQKHSSESPDKSDLQLKPDQGSSASSLTGESVSQTSLAIAKDPKKKGSSKTQKISTESSDKSDLQLKPVEGSSTLSLTEESTPETSFTNVKQSKKKKRNEEQKKKESQTTDQKQLTELPHSTKSQQVSGGNLGEKSSQSQRFDRRQTRETSHPEYSKSQAAAQPSIIKTKSAWPRKDDQPLQAQSFNQSESYKSSDRASMQLPSEQSNLPTPKMAWGKVGAAMPVKPQTYDKKDAQLQESNISSQFAALSTRGDAQSNQPESYKRTDRASMQRPSEQSNLSAPKMARGKVGAAKPVKPQTYDKKDAQLQESNISSQFAALSTRGDGQSTSQGDRRQVKPSVSNQPQTSIQKRIPEQVRGAQTPEHQVISRIKPQPGNRGRKIGVATNYFEITLGRHKSAIHYDVKIEPEIKIKKFNKDIMEIFRKQYLRDRYPAFDNMHNLYSYKPLSNDDTISKEVTFEGKPYKVTLSYIKEVDLTVFQDTFMSQITPQNPIQVINVILRSGPSKTLLSAGRSFFFKNQKCVDIGDGMQLYEGFYQSTVRSNKLLLNVDVAHKAVPKNNTVVGVLAEFGITYLEDYLRDFQLRKLNDFLKGLKVEYEIPGLPSSKRSYRVNSVRNNSARDENFALESGQMITVENYYRTVKGYKLKYPILPTLHVGNKERKIYVPLELCKLEKEQMVRKKLTDLNKQKMIANTATNTDIRKGKIMNSIYEANYNQDNTVREFDIRVSDQLLQLTGRVLDSPKLLYGNSRVIPKNGTWNKFEDFEHATINNWALISCVQERFLSMTHLQKLTNQIQRYGKIPSIDPRCIKMVGNRERDIMNFFRDKQNKQFDVIFVVVPDRTDDRSYAIVKQAAELQLNYCVTQCLKDKTVKSIIMDDRKGPQTVVNIMLKVNTKLNGCNHVLNDPPPILENAMVMGADVTHPSPESTNIPSVAAVSASHDKNASKYNVSWRLQQPKQEVIQDMKQVIREHLTFYRKHNNSLPSRIIFYRDGVSEGQFQEVFDKEVKDIRAACYSLNQNYNPPVTFVVVMKRHHTRLFPMDKRDCDPRDRNFNVPVGTCVDTDITHPFMQDFYLVSHASIRGVARPTRYCTLVNDEKLSNDDLEQLTYYLCHLYARCTRSVSYPAPTYNAHLVAARGKVYISTTNLDMNELDKKSKELTDVNVIRLTHPMFFV